MHEIPRDCGSDKEEKVLGQHHKALLRVQGAVRRSGAIVWASPDRVTDAEVGSVGEFELLFRDHTTIPTDLPTDSGMNGAVDLRESGTADASSGSEGR